MSSSSTAGNGNGLAEYSMETLSVNGEQIEVNKYLLAYNSSHFEDIFFGKDCKGEENKIIKLDPPATPEHFQRMLDALEPKGRPVDDECLEGLLHLANQFLLKELEGKCRTFLCLCSRRSAMFKYRLADKYGFGTLKKKIMDSSKEDFFKEANFVENLEEYAKMDEKAREALATRLGQLFEQQLQPVQSGILMNSMRSVLISVARSMKVDEFANRPGAAILLVNGMEVQINKYYLAYKSAYFERFFFGQGYKQNNNIELDPPANVAHFQRMLDTMEPWNRPLDDECIEPVLHLANQFLMREVEEKCHKFLAEKPELFLEASTRSAIYKYRLVDKYCSDRLKKQFLNPLKKEDFFKEADFVENLEEFARLDGKAREALAKHLRQLFANK